MTTVILRPFPSDFFLWGYLKDQTPNLVRIKTVNMSFKRRVIIATIQKIQEKFKKCRKKLKSY